MIFRVIRDHLTPEFAVTDCCRVLEVSTSGYYRWLRQPIGRRQTRRAELVEQIRSAHEASRRTYGSPRVQRALLHRGVRLNRKTVARIMRESSIRSKVARKFKPGTTDSDHAYPVAPNVLDRNFAIEKPDAAWLCDITYVPTASCAFEGKAQAGTTGSPSKRAAGSRRSPARRAHHCRHSQRTYRLR